MMVQKLDYEERFYAREMLRNALQQMSVHGETNIACDAASKALDGLDVVDVVDACCVDDRHKIRVQDAFVVATRAGVFDVRL